MTHEGERGERGSAKNWIKVSRRGLENKNHGQPKANAMNRSRLTSWSRSRCLETGLNGNDSNRKRGSCGLHRGTEVGRDWGDLDAL